MRSAVYLADAALKPIRRRFVDSHAHLWDARRHPWYSFPRPGNDSLGLGLKNAFPECYLWDSYRESLATVELIKWIHVSALISPENARAELDWLDSIAREGSIPYALIGTLDPALPLAEIETALDEAIKKPAYRGLRFFGGFDYETDKAHVILSMLEARKLVYDLVAGPGAIRTVAQAIAHHPDLTVVLEHVGWPHGTTPSDILAWGAEMKDLAAVPNVYCKLSGLAMVIHRNDVAIFRLFFEECIRLFGAERCMFGSNFPIDLSYGSAAELFAVFDEIAGAYSADEVDNLYVRTAERAYRI
jgi:L-fuconolactonase